MHVPFELYRHRTAAPVRPVTPTPPMVAVVAETATAAARTTPIQHETCAGVRPSASFPGAMEWDMARRRLELRRGAGSATHRGHPPNARTASRLGAFAMAAAAAAASIAARTKPRSVEGPAPPPDGLNSRRGRPAATKPQASRSRRPATAPTRRVARGRGWGASRRRCGRRPRGVYSAVRSLLEDGDFVAAVGWAYRW
jgi:hypothetical protein